MKKIILALSLTVAASFANDTTINATMDLMNQGLQQVQKGFVYNSKEDILRGIETIESANSIFTHVDVSTFIKNNSKIQVTKNINANLTKELKNFKQAVVAKDFSEATAQYAKVLNDCVSCHTIIRGW
jgi:hypothetical protein